MLCPNTHISICFEISVVEIVHFEPQLIFQSLICVVFSVKLGCVWNLGDLWHFSQSPSATSPVCHYTNVHISASVSVLIDIRPETYRILQQWISSITDFVPVQLIQSMDRKSNADKWPHQISICVFHSCHDKSNMLWLDFTSCAMTSEGVPVLGKVFWLLVQLVLLKLVPII